MTEFRDPIRVRRVLLYEGERSWVENTLKKSEVQASAPISLPRGSVTEVECKEVGSPRTYSVRFYSEPPGQETITVAEGENPEDKAREFLEALHPGAQYELISVNEVVDEPPE